MLWCTCQYKIGWTETSIRCKLTSFCQNLASQFQPLSPSRVKPGVSLPTCPSWLGQSRSDNAALASGSDRRLHLLQPKAHLDHRSERYEDVTQQRLDSLRQISPCVTFYNMYFFFLFSAACSVTRDGLKLIGSLSLLSEEVLWSLKGLPNDVFPSDHLSLLAKFQVDLNAAWEDEPKRIWQDANISFQISEVIFLIFLCFWLTWTPSRS